MERIYQELNQLLDSPLSPQDEVKVFEFDLYFIKLFYNRHLLNRETFCSNAVLAGNFSALQWGVRKKCPLGPSVYLKGVKSAQILDWLLERVPVDSILMFQLIGEGQLEMIKLLLQKSPVVWTDDLTAHAVRLGRFEILKMAHEMQLLNNFKEESAPVDEKKPSQLPMLPLPEAGHKSSSEPQSDPPTQQNDVADYSSRPEFKDAPESIKAFVREHRLGWERAAAKLNRVDVLKYGNPTASFIDPVTCRQYAEYGNLEVLKWLYQVRKDFPAADVFVSACYHEHIHILSWLLDEVKLSVHSVKDWIEVYKRPEQKHKTKTYCWLWRRFPCRLIGDVEISPSTPASVKDWFLSGGSSAPWVIAKAGRTDVLKWLCPDKHGCGGATYQYGIESGNLELIQWFSEGVTRKNWFDLVRKTAIERGFEDVLEWVDKRIKELEQKGK